MRCMVIGLFALLVALPASGAEGQGTGTSESQGPMRVAILGYHSSRMAYDLGDPGLTVANCVSTALTKSGRFDVYERQQLETLLQQQQIDLSGPVDPETAVKVGKMAGVQYVVYGEVESATPDVRVRGYQGYEGERVVNYDAEVQVTVHHVVTNVETGQKWKESRDRAAVSQSFRGNPPDGERLKELCARACEQTVSRFVGQLVPVVEGQVLGRDGKLVIVSLGKRQGVGLDVDIAFYRWKELRNSSGEVIKDPKSGEPLRMKEPVAINNHQSKESRPCIGRPSQIEDAHCLVEVGCYEKKHSLFSSRTEFERCDGDSADIKDGDVAVITPRPPDVK